jgi:hypothetical protein
MPTCEEACRHDFRRFVSLGRGFSAEEGDLPDGRGGVGASSRITSVFQTAAAEDFPRIDGAGEAERPQTLGGTSTGSDLHATHALGVGAADL